MAGSFQRVVFNGIVYTRTVNARRSSDRVYFRCSPHYKTQGFEERLHRAIWIDAHGAIPDGFVVHHLNSDPLDNRLDNLGLMRKDDHGRHHSSSPQHVAQLILQADKVRQWRRDHPDRVSEIASKAGDTYWANHREPVKVQCIVCGNGFLNRASHNKALFCSEACRTEYYSEMRVCQFCQKEYKIRRNYTNRFCSRTCCSKSKIGKKKASQVSPGGS